MLLGQMIQQILRARGLYFDQLGLTDVVLLGRINAVSTKHGLTTDEFIGDALQDLVNDQDSGDWATLMGRLQNSESPGHAFIDMAVRRHVDWLEKEVAPGLEMAGTAAAPQKKGGCGGGGGCTCGG